MDCPFCLVHRGIPELPLARATRPEPSVSPSLLRQVLRVLKGWPLARPLYLVAFGRSLVRKLASRGTPKTPAMTEVACWESRRPQRCEPAPGRPGRTRRKPSRRGGRGLASRSGTGADARSKGEPDRRSESSTATARKPSPAMRDEPFCLVDRSTDLQCASYFVDDVERLVTRQQRHPSPSTIRRHQVDLL